MSHQPGTLGSGSVGFGRIWRHAHNEDRYFEMQKEALEIWEEVEKKINQKINCPGGLLYIKHKDDPELKIFERYGERLSPSEISKRWPAFVLPDYLEGVFC